MKNILLLTDFSANALNAIKYALHFFSGGAFDFTVLNVQKTSSYTTGSLLTASSSSSSIYDSIIKDAKKALTKLVDELKQEFLKEQFTFDADCDYDTFTESVNQVVKNKKIDLIVMGTNGATDAKEVLFGSNTINVIRNVDCPVLVIPEGHVYKKPTSMAFVSESDEILDVYALELLQSMVNFQSMALEVLFIGSEEDHATIEFKKEKIAHHFNTSEHSFHTIFDVSADVGIDCFSQLFKSNMIAKIVNVKPFLKRLTSAKTTSKLTYKSKIPLLLMHPKS